LSRKRFVLTIHLVPQLINSKNLAITSKLLSFKLCLIVITKDEILILKLRQESLQEKELKENKTQKTQKNQTPKPKTHHQKPIAPRTDR